MKKIFLTISILLSVVYYLPTITYAQFNLGSFSPNGIASLADELTVDVIPTYPKPNSRVFVELRMYTEDLNSAMLSYLVNGKVIKESRGLLNFNFTIGGAGSKTTLTINIALQSGVKFSKEIIFQPATVDLLWQSDSFVPPFYRGKALFPEQGAVLISAAPQFNAGASSVDPSRLVYQWTVNDEVLESQSGYGKSAIRVSGPILGTSMEVEVLVTDPTSNLVADNFMTINPVRPIMVFYESSPLYGIVFEKAVNNGVELKGEEISVVATPFFLNARDPIVYSWSMNGLYTPNVSGLSATFRKPEDVSGSTFLSLKAENQRRILQFTEGGFSIKYKND
ncbi:MAG: hypothetical protein AAB863_03410 [Patescibacteria group bacterium]